MGSASHCGYCEGVSGGSCSISLLLVLYALLCQCTLSGLLSQECPLHGHSSCWNGGCLCVVQSTSANGNHPCYGWLIGGRCSSDVPPGSVVSPPSGW
ncbi:hypothetical protein I3842_15G093600 [Carya illinoinensis]|uniref:Secreted protein n=1 Tax=Carya illinoinensis TaxID=32201 RepID=A0A922AEL1_CARIL|nr:hypothetical protein I3842_15G093600 [Carya illinoinensis]